MMSVPLSEEQVRTPRFSLRGLLLTVTIVAVGIGAFRFVYHGNYQEFSQRIRSVNGICDVFVGGADDEEPEYFQHVELLQFRIEGKPNSYVEISGPDCSIFDTARHIVLSQIADLRVEAIVHDESREFPWRGVSVDIGPNSALKDVLPFTVRNLDELIARYDELEAYLRQWPNTTHYDEDEHEALFHRWPDLTHGGEDGSAAAFKPRLKNDEPERSVVLPIGRVKYYTWKLSAD